MFKVINVKDNVYTIERADGSGEQKCLHRNELKPCPVFIVQDKRDRPQRRAQSPLFIDTASDSDSEDEWYPALPHHGVHEHPVHPPPGRVTNPGGEDAGSPEITEPPVRRSARSTAGQHGNPHREPRSLAEHAQGFVRSLGTSFAEGILQHIFTIEK